MDERLRRQAGADRRRVGGAGRCGRGDGAGDAARPAVLGAAVTGFTTKIGCAAGDRERLTLNRWIRTSVALDAVFDVDAALRDPGHPDRMLPRYGSGDHLHPGDASYQKMAHTVDLAVLLRGWG
jgi:hypothetical protein